MAIDEKFVAAPTGRVESSTMILINRRAWLGLVTRRVLVSAQQVASAFQNPGIGGPEVLVSGDPIHEAFASPVVFNPTPGVVRPQAAAPGR